MSRDALVSEHDECPVTTGASALDRTIALPAFNVGLVAGLVALVTGALLRLAGLDRWPLSATEADIALRAHELTNGTGGAGDLAGAPTSVAWTAVSFFVGWPADSVARIAVALAGVAVIALTIALRRALDWQPAVWGAVLVAWSPTLVTASRRIDGGALYVALTLGVVACAHLSARRGTLAWPALAGVSTALLVLAGPLGAPAALLAWLAAILLADRPGAPRMEAIAAGVAAGLGAAVLVSTSLLTRPSSFTASIGENLSRLWDLHLSQAGERSWLPAFNLILNEPLLLALAVVAIFVSPRRWLVSRLGVWTLAAFALLWVLGAVSVAGYAIVALPLALLAGAGLAHVVERLPWGAVRRGPATLYVALVLLMAAAAISLIGLLTSGTGDDRVEWLLKFGLVVLVGVLPLSVALSWIGQRLAGDRLALTLAAALVLLTALTIRSAVLAASERPGLAGDPLAEGATSQAVAATLERVERVSRDLTMGDRDAQDPGGGHGLTIAVDEAIAQPFMWYLRDFPNANTFDPDGDTPALGADLIILDQGRDARVVAPGFSSGAFQYAAGMPPALSDPDWSDVLIGLVNPNQWRTFAGYLVNRQPAVSAPAREFQLLATGPAAERLFASAGPFNLHDRAGAGSAPGQLNRPRGVAVGPDGSVYVVDSRNARVNVYGADGTFLFSFGGEGAGPGQFARISAGGGGGASGIAIDVDGTVFVADTWNHRVQAFAPDGTYLFSWGQFFDAGDDPQASTTQPGFFYGPRGLAIHDGLLYVTDTGNERVQVFDLSGQFVTMFGAPGSADGQLREPVGVAVDPNGVVHVADSHNARVARFDPSGAWLGAIPVAQWQGQQFFEPYLAIAPNGRILVSGSASTSLIAIDPETQSTTVIQSPEMRQPFGIAVLAEGYQAFVTDGIAQAVLRVTLEP